MWYCSICCHTSKLNHTTCIELIEYAICHMDNISFVLPPLDSTVAQPIFGVSLGLAVVRGHCHDNVNLPLIVRECIDYLQEHGLQSEQIYKVDVVKTKLQHLKQVYNNRDTVPASEFDISTACSLLKLFIQWVFFLVFNNENLTIFRRLLYNQILKNLITFHFPSIVNYLSPYWQQTYCLNLKR